MKKMNVKILFSIIFEQKVFLNIQGGKKKLKPFTKWNAHYLSRPKSWSIRRLNLYGNHFSQAHDGNLLNYEKILHLKATKIQMKFQRVRGRLLGRGIRPLWIIDTTIMEKQERHSIWWKIKLVSIRAESIKTLLQKPNLKYINR